MTRDSLLTKIIINVENTKATNIPYTRLFAKVLNPYDKIHREKPVLKDFGNIKDCSVTRMKQNIVREQLANFVIGLLVNWAPCQLLVSHWTTQLLQVGKSWDM